MILFIIFFALVRKAKITSIFSNIPEKFKCLYYSVLGIRAQNEKLLTASIFIYVF
jgi:hypothetical protein